MKKIFFCVSLFLFAQLAFSQDTVWRKNGLAALNVSQVSLSNWAAGGQSSIAGNAILNYTANYSKGRIAWDNFLDLGYGAVMQGKNNRLFKTDDKMEFTSKFGEKAFGNFYYASLFNFRSQFAPGYNLPDDETYVSNFLAPGYFLLSVGMDYKPNPYWSVYVSPSTARLLVVNDKNLSDAGAFGVRKGERMLIESGAYFRTVFKKDVSSAVNLQASLDLFSNYLRKPENIDVNMQVLIAVKVSRYISATVSAQILYDDDTDLVFYEGDGKTINHTGPGLQFKEVLGIGLAYKVSRVTVR